MKTLIIILVLGLNSFLLQEIQAQENPVAVKLKVEGAGTEKEKIISEEKEELRKKVEKLNRQLENGEIEKETAERLKKEAAEKHALNIQNRVAILENDRELKARNDEPGFIDEPEEENRGRYYDRRTTTQLVVAAGFNNALEEGQSLDDSDFQLAGSRFFEIGWAWNTRVLKRSNWLRLRYGVSFQFNGLKPTDNRYFVQDGNLTTLESFDYELDKSKFRMDNLVVPIHFEVGPSKKYETDHSVQYSNKGQLKLGFGGYAGFNIGERQKLKYEADGDKFKEKIKNDYNTNDLVYGLSGYLGWGWANFYGKYDLNPIFEEPNTQLHNFSLGLRFDID